MFLYVKCLGYFYIHIVSKRSWSSSWSKKYHYWKCGSLKMYCFLFHNEWNLDISIVKKDLKQISALLFSLFGQPLYSVSHFRLCFFGHVPLQVEESELTSLSFLSSSVYWLSCVLASVYLSFMACWFEIFLLFIWFYLVFTQILYLNFMLWL